MKEKINTEESITIKSLLDSGSFSLQDISNNLDNRFTLNQIKYHINKQYPESKTLLKKEYSRGGSKLLFLLKQIFPANKVHAEYHVGEKLRLDAYVSSPFNIAFEFDGVQHGKSVAHFHGNYRGFLDAQERDELKAELCKGRGISLIRFETLDQMSIDQLNSKIEEVGYGSGVIVSDKFLTKREILERSKSKRDSLAKEKLKERKQAFLKESRDKQKQIRKLTSKDKSQETSDYELEKKENAKRYRKEQYKRQKEWKKQFKAKSKKK